MARHPGFCLKSSRFFHNYGKEARKWNININRGGDLQQIGMAQGKAPFGSASSSAQCRKIALPFPATGAASL